MEATHMVKCFFWFPLGPRLAWKPGRGSAKMTLLLSGAYVSFHVCLARVRFNVSGLEFRVLGFVYGVQGAGDEQV